MECVCILNWVCMFVLIILLAILLVYVSTYVGLMGIDWLFADLDFIRFSLFACLLWGFVWRLSFVVLSITP